MQNVYKVDLKGVYIEDFQYDGEIQTVARVYTNGDISENLSPEDKGEVSGYLINVPMKDKFYKPKFEIGEYFLLRKHYENVNKEARENFDMQLKSYEENYAAIIENWENSDRSSRSEERPAYQPPFFIPIEEPNYSKLWIELLSNDEINLIINPPAPANNDLPTIFISEINKINKNMDAVQHDVASSESSQESTMLALTDMYEQFIALQEMLNSLMEKNNN